MWRRRASLAAAVLATAAVVPASFGQIGNNICTDPDGVILSPGATNANGDQIVVNTGQVSGAGATLFVDFFLSPTSTHDFIDVDGDGCEGFLDATPGCPIVDQLGTFYSGGSDLTTELLFQYASVGSVNGFEYFIDSQACPGSTNLLPPSEAGIFNGLLYAEAGNVLFSGTPDNTSGTPLTPCAVDFAFLDVFGSWGVQVAPLGSAEWFRAPTRPGYGLCPIPSDSGVISNTQSLERQCGTCSNDPAVGCVADDNCVAPGVCQGFGPTVSLDQNVVSPTPNTIYSEVGAWVPVAPIGNIRAGYETFTFSELQSHFVTGRLPWGENLVGATRDVGSGTRNAFINSLGIDTSWGRGENIGDAVLTNSSSTDPLGPRYIPSNRAGSSRMEGTVRNAGLAIGYTGLGGDSRAAQDAQSGQYEILTICQDVDSPGICSATRDLCFTIDGSDCVPGGQTCDGYVPACNCDRTAVDTPAPGTGYVRPTVPNVLDNCDPCNSYRISGSGSFVSRGNRQVNLGTPGAIGFPIANNTLALYLTNVFNSVNQFSATQPGTCFASKTCQVSAAQCNIDADCGADGPCVATGCDDTGDCTQNTCNGNPQINCPAVGPAGDAVCATFGAGTCTAGGDECRINFNMPGEFLAQEFFLPDALECVHQFDSPLTYLPVVNRNIALRDYIVANTVIDVPPYGISAPTYPSDDNEAGDVPVRTTLPNSGLNRYSDGSQSGYYQYNGGPANMASSYPGISSGDLAERNAVAGDFNNDGVRDVNDAAEMVKAYYNPRGWQTTAAALGTGDRNDQAVDRAIPEVIGDFNGDGHFSKEDLRYFADGLALVPKYCSKRDGSGDLVSCTVDADCAPSFGFCRKWADRKAGAIAIDTAIGDGVSKTCGQRFCQLSGDRCTTDADCGAQGPCVCPQYPWAMTEFNPFTAGEIIESAGPLPGPKFPQTFTRVSGFHSTGKCYEPGDFRGDVAGRPGSILGRAANPGAPPAGWDGKVDIQDVNYVMEKIRAGNWVDDICPDCDYSADMDGNGLVDNDDLVELVDVILGTVPGDINLDGVVDRLDRDAHTAAICTAPDCLWSDGDYNNDGAKDAFPTGNCQDLSGVCDDVIAPDAPGVCVDDIAKQRYICFQPNNACRPVVYRVTHVDSGENNLYVGALNFSPAAAYSRNIANLASTPVAYSYTVNKVNVTGCWIAPDEAYTVAASYDGVTYGPESVQILTATEPTDGRFWADVVGGFSAGAWTAPNGLVNGFDVTAVLRTFQNNPANPGTDLERADLNPAVPDRIVNGQDVLQVVNAFALSFYGSGAFAHPDGAGCTICGPAPTQCPAPPAK